MRLTQIEKRWLEALFDGFAPATDDAERLAPRAGEVDPAAVFERLNGFGGLKVRVGVRLALAFLASAPIWESRRLAFIDALDTEERTALLEALSDHPLQLVQELTLLMKVQTAMALLGAPEVRARSRYDHQRAEQTPVRLRLRVKEVA